ncbi:MAG: thymidylate synthase [Candidatus Uhrbacteria bacterium]
MTTFDRLYLDTVGRIYREGETVQSERTGISTRAIPGITYELEPSKGFPLLTVRKMFPKFFCAETVWFIAGHKHAGFLQQFTKGWDSFLEDDGTVETAYGYRWRHHFGRDQLLDLVEHLREEPSSRQGVVMMWDPASDGLRAPKKKNVPCPFTWTVNIIGGKLNLHMIMRSNDMVLGNPNDTADFALLQAMLAQELNVAVGKLTISISHAHIYENQFDAVKDILGREVVAHPEIVCRLPENSFRRALGADASLVGELVEMFSSQYQPGAPMMKVQIAV